MATIRHPITGKELRIELASTELIDARAHEAREFFARVLDFDFDWDTAVRGRHFIPLEKGTVTLDEDVYGIFRTSEEVNNALRMLISEGRIPHFVSDAEWYAKHKKNVTAESTSPPVRRARRGGVRRP